MAAAESYRRRADDAGDEALRDLIRDAMRDALPGQHGSRVAVPRRGARSNWRALLNMDEPTTTAAGGLLALVPIIKSFDGTVARWKMLPDGRLRVIRDDGAEFAY